MSDRASPRGLFADYASGEIDEGDLRLLETSLREDAALRLEFIEYMNVDSALGDLAALTEAEADELDAVLPDGVAATSSRTASRRRVLAVVLTGAIAATLVIVACRWNAGPAREPVARLVTTVDAVLRPAEAGTWDGATLTAGRYTLERGLLHLRFGGGVMVYLEAPARFDAASAGRLVLHNGRLSARVPPDGVGFTVGTPGAEVIDFGTEFSVEVESGTSEVHVFKGLVRVRPKAAKDREAGEAVDLGTAQAVRIVHAAEKPVDIDLAADRFIRAFDEPKPRYPRTVKHLSPVAYYRMPIRDRGLVAEPPRYSGVVLTGPGLRPPHASGVFAGGSLRVMANSTGRGGRVDAPPPLRSGRFSLAAFVYLDAQAHGGTVATNLRGDLGSFSLGLDGEGLLRATIRGSDGALQAAISPAALPLSTWLHLVMTADGQHLRIYQDGQLVASRPCGPVAAAESGAVWFGTDPEGVGLWDGRIDELAMFDRALSGAEIAALYRAALEEM